MSWRTHGPNVQEGDIAQLVGMTHKNFIFRVLVGGLLHTHRGVIQHDDMIGKPWGSQVFSHNGSPFFILPPSIADILKDIPRISQILYAKDIGFILLTLGIGPGQEIVEAGSGSGAMTSAMAYAIGSEGHITSYESREDMHRLARKNLARFGLDERVTLKLKDIGEGIDERGVDIVFLDLPNPEDYISIVRTALKPGGKFGCILPTTNQVARLLVELHRNDFIFVDVCEISLRYYKPDPERLRPTDRMVAHTGFLIFARPVLMDNSARVEILAADLAAADGAYQE